MFLIQALRATYVGSDTIQYVEIYNKFSISQYYKYKLTQKTTIRHFISPLTTP